MSDIREFRKKFRLTQSELGIVLGLSPKAVSNIEIGFRKPGRSVIRLVQVINSVPSKQASIIIAKMISVESSPPRGRL